MFAIACRTPPDCERALDRLERIGRGVAVQSMRESCRAGELSMSDPVIRCALDTTTDLEATDCIDRFLGEVLRPDPAAGGGGGINPLLR